MTDWHGLVGGLGFLEGPRWHEGRLWFSSFTERMVFAVDQDGALESIVEVDQQPSGLGWLPDGRLLVVSMIDRRVLRLDPGGLVEHGALGALASGNANDMVVAANGNAYVGNFGFDLGGLTPDAPRPTTNLALVRPDGSVSGVAAGLAFPNGSVITPDGSTLIVGESMAARYTAFRIADDGSLHDRRVWAETPGMSPDGCCLDAEGAIWFADARGQRVVRVAEGGSILMEIATPQPSFACMLGGLDGRTLFVLTAASHGPASAGTGTISTTTVDVPHAGLP